MFLFVWLINLCKSMYLVAPIQRLITPNLSQNRRRFVFWNMKNDVIMFLKKKSPDLRSDAEREHKFINKNQNTICSNYLVDSRGVQKPYKCVRATLCSLHTVVGARSHFCTPLVDSINFSWCSSMEMFQWILILHTLLTCLVCRTCLQ